jgi:hypothetical protein
VYPQSLNYLAIIPIRNTITIIRPWKNKIKGKELKV